MKYKLKTQGDFLKTVLEGSGSPTLVLWNGIVYQLMGNEADGTLVYRETSMTIADFDNGKATSSKVATLAARMMGWDNDEMRKHAILYEVGEARLEDQFCDDVRSVCATALSQSPGRELGTGQEDGIHKG